MRDMSLNDLCSLKGGNDGAWTRWLEPMRDFVRKTVAPHVTGSDLDLLVDKIIDAFRLKSLGRCHKTDQFWRFLRQEAKRDAQTFERNRALRAAREVNESDVSNTVTSGQHSGLDDLEAESCPATETRFSMEELRRLFDQADLTLREIFIIESYDLDGDVTYEDLARTLGYTGRGSWIAEQRANAFGKLRRLLTHEGRKWL